MNVLSGLVGMIAVLLAAGGVSKALAPAPTVASFRAVGLPARRGLVRALAVGEVALGLALIVVGTAWLAALGAVVFMVFTGISARLLALGDAAASCGCFGAQSARPSALHVVIDGAAVVVLGLAALLGLPGLASHWGATAHDARLSRPGAHRRLPADRPADRPARRPRRAGRPPARSRGHRVHPPPMIVLVVLEGVVLALLAVLVVGLLRTHAEILRRLHDLGAGVYDDQAAAGSAAGQAGRHRCRCAPGPAWPSPAPRPPRPSTWPAPRPTVPRP